MYILYIYNIINQYGIYSDMWSLGIILYALCYNKIPYSDPDPSICKNKILQHVELNQDIKSVERYICLLMRI